jgi:hypothetical protein
MVEDLRREQERDTEIQTQTEFRLQKNHRRFFNKYKRKRQEKSLMENGTAREGENKAPHHGAACSHEILKPALQVTARSSEHETHFFFLLLLLLLPHSAAAKLLLVFVRKEVMQQKNSSRRPEKIGCCPLPRRRGEVEKLFRFFLELLCNSSQITWGHTRRRRP